MEVFNPLHLQRLPLTSTSVIKIDRKDNIFSEQYFNHGLLIILPDAVNFPENVRRELCDNSYFGFASDVPVHHFCDATFIKQFAQRGLLTLLSPHTKLDQDNCLAITPNGHMRLSLRDDTYYALGLEGKPSRFNKNKRNVIINLKSLKCEKDNKDYIRLITRLKESKLTFNVAFVWENGGFADDNDISEITSWFQNLGFPTKICSNQYSQQHCYDLKVPDLDTEELSEVLTWIGMVGMDLFTAEKASSDNVRSLFNIEYPTKFCPQVTYCKWTGMLSYSRIEKALGYLSKWATSRTSNFWVSAVVNGFEDAPTSDGRDERGYFKDGAHSQTVIFPVEGPSVFVNYKSPSQPPHESVSIQSHKRRRCRHVRKKRRLK